MTENNRSDKVKIQDRIPIRTIGIETERERKDFTHLPPQNYVHVWWARRPTAASRVAVLSSLLPEDVSDDQLLEWMGVQPNNKPRDKNIAEHVRDKRKTADSRDGAEYEHYGYRKIWRWTPDDQVREDIHQKVTDCWGEVPKVLDATAGGGSIPFESVKYEFPTSANELNPVASVILQAVLKHPRVNGDLSDEIKRWGEEINSHVRDELEQYFPAEQGEDVLTYLWAHTINCPDCGLALPLSPTWWLDKDSGSKGIAARPKVDEDNNSVEFEVVSLPEDVEKSEFDPTEGSSNRGKANCLNCDVTIESKEIQEQAQDGLDSQLYAVYTERKGGREFRPPTEQDIEAYSEAQKKVHSDVDLSTALDDSIPSGEKTDEPRRYGLEEWRDMYNSRQLLSHHQYWESFESVKPRIYDEHDEPVADAICTFLACAADKAADYNSRLCSWHNGRSVIRNTFERHDFHFKKSYAENNLLGTGVGYEWMLENVITAYNDLRELSGGSSSLTNVYQGDAADLPIDDNSIQAIVLDPPYYDNVMYSELSDFFYVWMRKYLGDIYPDFFRDNLSDKDREAVANPSKFEGVATGDSSKSQLAKEDYEDMMTDIFSELHRVLSTDGVFTLMFTHKKTEAWDTLTSALIEAGFVVTATHPINTESPLSLHQAGKNSAESTMLLTSEKRGEADVEYTLWSEIQSKTKTAAREKAEQLEEGELDIAKVDVILASFGPTLEVFTRNYPVVDDEGNKVPPRIALDEARSAVRDYFIERYLNEGVTNVDPKTEWYILSWLVFEAQRFPYDEARRLAIGVGEDLDALKKTHRMWRKRSGDVIVRPHGDRVQDINKDRDNRSGRKPVDPDALSFATSLDKVHAAMHIYDAKGSTEAWNWMNDRNYGSDPTFKATLEALLRVLPHDHADWEIARNLAVGETGELLDLDLDAEIFEDEEGTVSQDTLDTYSQ